MNFCNFAFDYFAILKYFHVKEYIHVIHKILVRVFWCSHTVNSGAVLPTVSST